MNTTVVNVNEFLGHMVKVEFKPKNHYQTIIQDGKIIYSSYNASLCFMPKGSRIKGYIIESETDIKWVEIIRKNNKENAFQIENYKNIESDIITYNHRMEEQEREYKAIQEEQKRRFEEKRQLEKLEKEKQKQEAASICNYEELENEVMEFYNNSGEPFNETTVKNTFLPMLAKIAYKGIKDITVYPKHFFDKKSNPRFCKLLEMKTNVKLANTQKKNLEILNEYLNA